jgi:hypothetical protein
LGSYACDILNDCHGASCIAGGQMFDTDGYNIGVNGKGGWNGPCYLCLSLYGRACGFVVRIVCKW